jgi:predicted DNA-binding transcriptional regulator AlpA
MTQTLFDPLVCCKEGAAMIGGSVSTWWRRVADGTLPPPIRIGGMSRWRRSEIEAVINKAAAQREAA